MSNTPISPVRAPGTRPAMPPSILAFLAACAVFLCVSLLAAGQAGATALAARVTAAGQTQGGAVLNDPAPATTPYVQRVNCGAGYYYYDNNDNIWLADQPFAAGQWGYVGGQTSTQWDAIGNTTDQELYRYNRWWSATAQPAYRFTVPNGQYEVTLKFAEIYDYCNAANCRRFSIRIEGAIVLANYDIYLDAGRRNWAAPDKIFTVHVADGELTIDLIKTGGNEGPSVNAIQVRELAPTATPTLTATPSVPTPTVPTATATPTASRTLTAVPTATATATQPADTPTPTDTATPEPTVTETFTVTPTSTPTPSSTWTSTATATVTRTPSITPRPTYRLALPIILSGDPYELRPWEKIASIGERVNSFASFGNTIYAGTDNGVYRGRIDAPFVLPSGQLTETIVSALLVGQTGQELYAATYNKGVWLSLDQGNQWSEFNYSLTNKHGVAIAWSGSGGSSYPVLVTTDGGAYYWDGARWRKPSPDIDASGRTIAADPLNPGKLYAGTVGRLYSSADGGRSWTEDYLPGQCGGAVWAIAVAHPYLYVGSEFGLCYRTDGSGQWQKVSAIVSTVYALAAQQNLLAVGTKSQGVWLGSGGALGRLNIGLPADLPTVNALMFNSDQLWLGTMDGAYVRRISQ